MMKIPYRLLSVLSITSMIVLAGQPPEVSGQSFVEYPNHPGTHGDHTVTTEWVGGPSAVTLTLETDESILHADGMGQAQRTARNTQTFVDDGSPQTYDNPDVIDLYGERLPLLQQMSANGVSTLSYDFATPVNQRVNLFITDVDSGDIVRVRAFDSSGDPIDMREWTLVDDGDLSLIRDTGTAMSTIVAPAPTTIFNANRVRLTAVSNTNFNRSYSILRAPENADIGRIDIEFTGLQTSTSRDQPFNGSHIYVALASEIPELPTFVEYPNHPAIYGDHNVATEWLGGPSAVTLTLETDESILHADGIGQAQRTARNTQNFVEGGSPQTYDNPAVIDLYGERLPLLQQMSADGVSTLSYDFATPVNQAVDLFITDVDSGDNVRVRASDSSGNPIDMRNWTLIDEGDLSLIRDTAPAMSTVVAPTPTTLFNANRIRLTAVSDTNFNRSYSILRSPENVNLGRIDIEFTGQQTSTSRQQPLNGSHIYVALASAVSDVLLGDINMDGTINFLDIAPFVELLTNGGFQASADIDQNGVVNFQDIQPFVDILSGP